MGSKTNNATLVTILGLVGIVVVGVALYFGFN